MIRVYVAGPITKGDYMLNVRRAVLVAHDLRELGFLPYVPHLSTLWHYAMPREYEDWMAQDFGWIEVCDALLRVPGESAGADREILFAASKNIPVFHSVAELAEWANETNAGKEAKGGADGQSR